MAKVVKLSKDGEQIYPQTITNAIADVNSKMVLSDLLQVYDQRIQTVEAAIGVSGDTSEYIDNLMELLRFFNGIKDDTTFKAIIEKFVEAQDAEDNPDTVIDESAEFPDFDDLVSDTTGN